MAGVSITITGASAYLRAAGRSRPRPYGPGDVVVVDEATATQLVESGVARYTADPEPEPVPIEDQYSEMDLAQLRRAAAEAGIEGMEKASKKAVQAALREMQAAGESAESRIGSGDRR